MTIRFSIMPNNRTLNLLETRRCANVDRQCRRVPAIARELAMGLLIKKHIKDY